MTVSRVIFITIQYLASTPAERKQAFLLKIHHSKTRVEFVRTYLEKSGIPIFLCTFRIGNSNCGGKVKSSYYKYNPYCKI